MKSATEPEVAVKTMALTSVTVTSESTVPILITVKAAPTVPDENKVIKFTVSKEGDAFLSFLRNITPQVLIGALSFASYYFYEKGTIGNLSFALLLMAIGFGVATLLSIVVSSIIFLRVIWLFDSTAERYGRCGSIRIFIGIFAILISISFAISCIYIAYQNAHVTIKAFGCELHRHG